MESNPDVDAFEFLRGGEPAIPAMRTTVDDPFVVRAPRLGFLNLLGPEAGLLLDEDRAAFEPLFTACVVSRDRVPDCDVLVMYCHFGVKGEITSFPLSLRQVIRDSGAVIVLVAAENPVEGYIAAFRDEGYGTANLVMTLDRKGPVFSTFVRQLFVLMASGVTMPLAWVQLAPQIPGMSDAEAPETIFACEAGHLVFAPVS